MTCTLVGNVAVPIYDGWRSELDSKKQSSVLISVSEQASDSDGDLVQTQLDELYSQKKSISVNFERFFGWAPRAIDRRFQLALSDHTYLPKVDNPKADWVVCSASVAFNAYRACQYNNVKRFATVGTGSGTDVIAATDIFPNLTGLAMTDIHEDVVALAKRNVWSATEKAADETRSLVTSMVARAGDVLEPLQEEEPFDLIYENLPNIPLRSQESLTDGQVSSTYVTEHLEAGIPIFVSNALLDLHYLCLVQARNFGILSRRGAVLSSMGGRIPVDTMLQMSSAAGFVGHILSLSWKIQSEPESVIGGYVDSERDGKGPFQFYPANILDVVFAGRTATGAALCASQIDSELLPHRLTATEALTRHREGVIIGHTVVVLASVQKV